MLNVVSILIGALALLMAIPALFPLFGWLNWFVLPVAFIGLAIGVLSRSTAGRNLNLVVLIVAIVRLSLGGGIL